MVLRALMPLPPLPPLLKKSNRTMMRTTLSMEKGSREKSGHGGRVQNSMKLKSSGPVESTSRSSRCALFSRLQV